MRCGEFTTFVFLTINTNALDTFLDTVAQKVLDQHPKPEKVCLIFPNRRAGVFFRESLKRHAKKPFLLPDIFSMQDFVARQSGLFPADPITLSFELYEVHRGLRAKSADPFTEFLKYSNTIIHDFNEIDFYLLNSKEVFRFLTDISKLKVWDVRDTQSDAFKRRYVQFFQSLAGYYSTYTKRLLKQGIAYQGLAYRTLAERGIIATEHWEKVYFVGFNALTPAEQQITDILVKEGKGELLWDVDAYYLEDKGHEAGHSLRRLFKKWPLKEYLSNHFREQAKSIHLLGAPGAVAQVKAAGERLRQYSDEDVAIVLADETLLEPLINSIPENISAFNITMGLPLENTILYSLFSALFKLHTAPYHMESNRQKSGEVMYYFKDVLRVLAHPAVTRMIERSFTVNGSLPRSPAYMVKENDLAFYSWNDLEKLHHDIGVKDFDALGFLWEDWKQNPLKAIDSLLVLLDYLREMAGDKQEGDMLMPEYVVRFRAVLQRIHTLQKEYGSMIDIDVLWHLFRQLTAREEVNFRGEPLKGVQVMGMLETRTLDFKNVIVVGANEEHLPGNNEEVSFFPYELRTHYHLPMKNDRASVYAYHFYHLLQRAENITLIYSNSAEGLSNSEESRFLKQLRYELPAANPSITITEDVAAFPPDMAGLDEDIVISKTETLLESLKSKAEKGLSATALNKYRQCSLKFYFEEILGVSQQEEVEETIEAKTLGIVIHNTLEKLYKNFHNGKEITKATIDAIGKKVEEKLNETFAEVYQKKPYKSGKNLLIYHLALHWLKGFLKAEQETLRDAAKKEQEYTYLDSEKLVETTLTIAAGEDTFSVRFKGYIDRIDRKGDAIRIIDYKTGKVMPQALTLRDIDSLEQADDKKEAFQLLFYEWLYRKSQGITSDITAGIYSFPALNQGFMRLSLQHAGADGKMNDFEGLLKTLTEELFNPENPFRKTENRLNCRFCDFKNICNRHM